MDKCFVVQVSVYLCVYVCARIWKGSAYRAWLKFNSLTASGKKNLLIFSMVMNKHSYLSTRLADLNNIKMYTVDKQYKNRRHIGLNA